MVLSNFDFNQIFSERYDPFEIHAFAEAVALAFADIATDNKRSFFVSTATGVTWDQTKDVCIVNTTTGAAATVSLPTASLMLEREVSIIDGGNNASSNNITVANATGTTKATISTDGGSARLFSDGDTWFSIT